MPRTVPAVYSLSGAIVCLIFSAPLFAADSKPTNDPFAEPSVNHPVVAGFERFFTAVGANAPKDLGPGGKLLLGELGCVACHQPA